MGHNSAAPEVFPLSSYETVRCWNSQSLDLHLKPMWTHLIFVEVIPTGTKFLELSGHCTVINSIFTFCTANIFSYCHSVMALFELIKHNYLVRLCCMLTCAAFKSLTEWSNPQHVSALTTTGTTNSGNTVHSLNSFGHIILQNLSLSKVLIRKREMSGKFSQPQPS